MGYPEKMLLLVTMRGQIALDGVLNKLRQMDIRFRIANWLMINLKAKQKYFIVLRVDLCRAVRGSPIV
jgi:hypothetical protein